MFIKQKQYLFLYMAFHAGIFINPAPLFNMPIRLLFSPVVGGKELVALPASQDVGLIFTTFSASYTKRECLRLCQIP